MPSLWIRRQEPAELRLPLMKIRDLGLFALSFPVWGAQLVVYPPSIELTGRNATQVLAVSLDGREVTSECRFTAADQALFTVSKEAVVTAHADGKSTLKVSCRGTETVVPVRIASAREEPQLSFVKDVVPIFTMAGCANSNCHGSIRGQNGFKLSLFGYEPELDFDAIVKQQDARRINRAEPAKSLILLKPTFSVSHGGGERFKVGSLEYNAILEWLREGATFDSPGSPRLKTLSVTPEETTMVGLGSRRQLKALGVYTNGASEDLTRKVQFTANDESVVEVSASGEVRAKRAG